MQILETIHGHHDLETLDPQQRETLCSEIRQTLIDKVSKTGGHVASNLGVVELTVALETVFDTEKDRLVFDVGHQSYVHKLLTGRMDEFDGLRQFGGIAGFPKPTESPSDAFTAGHASTAVSVALGMARARTLQGEDYHVIALLGDGAATGGVAFEGLNDSAVSREPLIIILNDNAMSIDKNVGGMARHLSRLRTKARYLGAKERSKEALSKIPGGNAISRVIRKAKSAIRRMLLPPTIFESMGFSYIGPIDGHDTENLIKILNIAKSMKKPVVIHVMTQKGRGYLFAQKNPRQFHGIGKFDPQTGEAIGEKKTSFSDVFGAQMVQMAENNPKVCAITAAMPSGTGLLEFMQRFPKRMFDVGIAEEHAVSMAGGLAKQGMTPVVAIYSTFLQRAYDMILQDVCMQNLHVVFAVDRAGLVGGDGETHHGVFDVDFLCHAPHMTVLSPVNAAELRDMLEWAVNVHNGPVAIRYPRGGAQCDTDSAWKDINSDGLLVTHKAGNDVLLVTYGTMLNNVLEAAELLVAQGISAGVTRLLSLSPLPIESLSMCGAKHVVVVEEVSGGCGVGAMLAQQLNVPVTTLDLGCNFVTHGDNRCLYEHYGLDAKSIAQSVQEVLHSEK